MVLSTSSKAFKQTILTVLITFLAQHVSGLSSPIIRAPVQTTDYSPVVVTRRSAFNSLAAVAAVVFAPTSFPASAAIPPAPASTERAALLSLIDVRASDSVVLKAVDALVPFDPSKGRGAAEPDLGGEWKLIWSYGAEAFSPLLTLPKPFRPESLQYLGDVATSEVGEGRVAQGLTGGVLFPGTGLQLWLSSGAVVAEDDPSVLVIKPPFRLQLGGQVRSGTKKKTVVEGGSDADFRSQNARTVEAQEAPPNRYKQMYLEGGGSGALRVSTITDGDPVIVGATFVHQKI